MYTCLKHVLQCLGRQSLVVSHQEDKIGADAT